MSTKRRSASEAERRSDMVWKSESTSVESASLATRRIVSTSASGSPVVRTAMKGPLGGVPRMSR